VVQGLLQRRTSLAKARPVYALKRFSSSKPKTNIPLPSKRTVIRWLDQRVAEVFTTTREDKEE
jgi:hypothetical protein